MPLRLVRYTEEPSTVTPYTAYTEEDNDPTWRFELSKSDAIWEAQERLRFNNTEAAGVWLLVAEGL
jgi:hypothetical protein